MECPVPFICVPYNMNCNEGFASLAPLTPTEKKRKHQEENCERTKQGATHYPQGRTERYHSAAVGRLN